MGTKQNRLPGDRTLEYGVDSLLTIRFMNMSMREAARKLYSIKNTDKNYFIKMFALLNPDKNVDQILELSEVSRDYFVGAYTERFEEALEDIKVPIITPWEVEIAKGIAGLTPLLGPVRNKLPILVVVDEQEYNYELTEDFMFGILTVIDAFDASNKFKFYIDDKSLGVLLLPITIFDIAANYVSTEIKKRFVAVTFLGEATFDTIDVIQGVITAASWLNVDPHKCIKDIFDNGQKVTF